MSMTRAPDGARPILLFRDGRFPMLGDDRLEGAHRGEECPLQLADLAAVDDQIVLARQRR